MLVMTTIIKVVCRTIFYRHFRLQNRRSVLLILSEMNIFWISINVEELNIRDKQDAYCGRLAAAVQSGSVYSDL